MSDQEDAKLTTCAPCRITGSPLTVEVAFLILGDAARELELELDVFGEALARGLHLGNDEDGWRPPCSDCEAALRRACLRMVE